MTDWETVRKQFPVTSSVAYLNTAAGATVTLCHESCDKYYRWMMADRDVHLIPSVSLALADGRFPQAT